FIATDIQGPYFSVPLEDEIWISAGKRMDLNEAKNILNEKKTVFENNADRFTPELKNTWTGIITSLGYNTIYDPSKDRVVSTVARSWNVDRGGYAFFGWDNFFLAYLCALEDRGLAFANVIEHLNDRTPEGFIPNTSQGNGRQTLDRSQPPVGSMMVKEIYKMYPEKWFLEAVFDKLLIWNRWWMENRYHDGLLCWGSNEGGNPYHDNNYHNFGGAILETGLDDSPMYLDVPFNSETNLLELHDIGLNSLYVEDCESLAELANILGRDEDAEELTKRAEKLKSKLSELWSEKMGVFLNKRTDTNEFSEVLAPTLFYIWLTGIPSDAQTESMIARYLLNTAEFWGDYVLPSISKTDPHFRTQKYWKGAVWAPLNFLVYLSLRDAGLYDEASLLAKKSEELFRNEWKEHRYVAENYSSLDGTSDNPLLNSHRFYTWGALMGIMEFMEEGYLPEYEKGVQ
ncbi:MAG: MGH1-like glycoside hydrolase domain-containing protein, partial [Bacteroidales bacterium]